MTKSTKGFKVFEEAISPENVQEMAELLAVKETKMLTAFSGTFIGGIHRKLVDDIAHKDNLRHILSDSYELVQAVALFLCEHFGEHLDDFYTVSRKGKRLTLKMECYRIVTHIINARYRRLKSDLSAENTLFTFTQCEEIALDERYDYSAADEMLDKMKLTNTHRELLNYRMSGASLRQIAKYLSKRAGTVFDLLTTIRHRYFKYILND